MIRRIVTQNDREGRSYIVSDAAAGNIEIPFPQFDPQFKFFNLWTTDTMPVKLDDSDPIKDKHISTSPPSNGSLFRLVNYPPEHILLNRISSMDEDELNEFEKTVGVRLILNGGHPLMHLTKSIDFCVVLSGEIYLILDKEEVHLKQFDTVIQRGTSHAWSNRSNTDCLMAYVLLDADTD